MKERKDYLLRGIDPGLWKDFKTACAHYGIPMRATLIKHMQIIVDDYNLIEWRKRKGKSGHWREVGE